MLIQTDQSVKEIALASYFTKCFKAHFGKRPLDFRKKETKDKKLKKKHDNFTYFIAKKRQYRQKATISIDNNFSKCYT